MFQGFIIKEEGSDGDWDADEAAKANELDADLFTSDDEEDEAITLDDPNEPEVKSGDEVIDDDAWMVTTRRQRNRALVTPNKRNEGV